MDNGTMVEAFKYLNYCQLAMNSLVSKRFRNVIETHRHKLALLYVDTISMKRRFRNSNPAPIKMFNKELSLEAYNEWIVHNNNSEQFLPERQAAGDHHDYELSAYGEYKYPNPKKMSVFYARVKEINLKTWPLFEHFIRLLTDLSIYIRDVELTPQTNILNLLTVTIDHSNRGRLQCEELNFNYKANAQKFLSWIKDQMRCVKFRLAVGYGADRDRNLLNFFVTGSDCASKIDVLYCHILKVVVVDLVQEFMDLKSRLESQLSIKGSVSKQSAEELKTTYKEFLVNEKENNYGWTTPHIYEFVNAIIAKKLQLTVTRNYYTSNQVILKIVNL